MLTKALYMQAFNLLHSFPPVSRLFEADEINPMSKVGTAADPRCLFLSDWTFTPQKLEYKILQNTVPGSIHLKKKKKYYLQ